MEQIVHLHNHSMYSLLDGFGKPEDYLKRANEIGSPAFAITEHGNEYSWCYFDKLSEKYPNIKMIYGVELYEAFDMTVKDPENKYFHLIALAKNEKGRIALNELVTKSEFEGFYYHGRVDINAIKPYAENLIITSACLASKLSREKDFTKCIDYINEYKAVFPYFYLEMQSHATKEQEEYNKKILQLATETNTEYIVTCDSHVAYKSDLYYQNYFVKIAHDNETSAEIYQDCYMQSVGEIHNIMDKQIGKANTSLAMLNTVKIADMIEDVHMPFQSPQLPTYPVPSEYGSNYDYLKSLCEEGYVKRGLNQLPDEKQNKYKERLEYELSVIHQMGFDGYFLIVWDFINFAKNNNVPVGDGRGSGAGSIVNWLLQISTLDPIKYNLIFERFLNPERISMPDIDTDFAKKELVIEYLQKKYGEDNVCQVINFSYMTPVVAIKDVGKILNIPYAVTEKISKKFTDKDFQANLDRDSSIIEEYPEYTKLFDIASHLSGRVKTVSTHAGGVGIVDTKITDYMAMRNGNKDEHVIEVDKHFIEDIGIIKFDLLGVSTLKIVDEVVRRVNIDTDYFNASNDEFLHDKDTYDLLGSGNTDGVFQVESQGMKNLLTRLQPTNIEDVSAILALYRPDSMGMLENFIYNKYHPDEITYWHDDLKPILQRSYGCLIYQEQTMEITRVFGGRTYGGADKFRKAIGKKMPELVKSESQKLKQEIIDNGYDETLATTISDYLAKMGGYAFNLSHSLAYSMLTYKTAYLKAHYPVEFFCALLNKNKDDYSSINKYIIDSKQFNVVVLPPHINKSQLYFDVNDNCILFGISAISGIGEKFAKVIIDERNNNGKFRNLKNFIDRTNPTKSQVISLIKAGAFPCKNKKKLLLLYAKSLIPQKTYKPVKTLPSLYKLKEVGIDTDVVKDKDERLRKYNIYKKAEFEVAQDVKIEKQINDFQEKYLQNEELWEFEALSIFISENPFVESFKYITSRYDTVEDDSSCIIAGIITKVQKKKDRNNQQIAFVNVYSTSGIIEVTVWASVYKRFTDYLKRGTKVVMRCYKQNKESCQLQDLKLYDDWIVKKRKV